MTSSLFRPMALAAEQMAAEFRRGRAPIPATWPVPIPAFPVGLGRPSAASSSVSPAQTAMGLGPFGPRHADPSPQVAPVVPPAQQPQIPLSWIIPEGSPRLPTGLPQFSVHG